jgi:hypothetical protein
MAKESKMRMLIVTKANLVKNQNQKKKKTGNVSIFKKLTSTPK